MNTESRLSAPPPQSQRQSQRFGLGLMAVAAASAVMASMCCVVPLLLVLVGIGGAWMTHLTAFKPYTAPFTVITLVALAWAGYLVFRPLNACSTDGAECDSACRMMRKLFVACAIFIAALLLFPYAAPLFY